MDLYKAIKALHEEKKRLDRLISSLEQMHARGIVNPAQPKTRSRRGRRGMSAEERQQVSERMKRYWANRRAIEQNNPQGESGEHASAAVASVGIRADPVF